jgi:hypothetical protein
MSDLCAVPGCTRPLARDAYSGVCRDHRHAAGYCRCVQCGGTRPSPAVAAMGSRHGERAATPEPAGEDPKPRRGITLPLEPWRVA